MGDIPRYYSKYLLPACIYCTASAAIAAILEVLQIYISCYKLTYERMPDWISGIRKMCLVVWSCSCCCPYIHISFIPCTNMELAAATAAALFLLFRQRMSVRTSSNIRRKKTGSIARSSMKKRNIAKLAAYVEANRIGGVVEVPALSSWGYRFDSGLTAGTGIYWTHRTLRTRHKRRVHGLFPVKKLLYSWIISRSSSCVQELFQL